MSPQTTMVDLAAAPDLLSKQKSKITDKFVVVSPKIIENIVL
jgi:hypothetical protein